MGRMIDSVKTANSLVRTGIVIVVLAALSYGGYLTFLNYIQPGFEAKEAKAQLVRTSQQLADLNRQLNEQAAELESRQAKIAAQAGQIDELTRQNEELAMANKLLKVDHRLARIKILDKGIDTQTGEKFLLVEFVEINDAGLLMGKPKQYRLKGEKLYLDAFIVKFNDELVENADALRSASMYMFKRIFGDDDGLTGGYPLDVDSQGEIQAAAYVSQSRLSAFEKEIWSRFWDYANDPNKQKELGVRNMHGQINYIDPKPGQIYEFTLRSSDGLSFNILGE